MSPGAMTGHTGFREPFKKNYGQISYIKHVGENNAACLACFQKKLRIYLWKLIRKADNRMYYFYDFLLSVTFCFLSFIF